jgi:hypothetical protein
MVWSQWIPLQNVLFVRYTPILLNLFISVSHYESEGPGIDPRWCRWGIFPWHPTIPCARSRLSLLKMSTRILLGVKTAGAYG